ncbi:MAG: winged helix-turn-helix domain-containing protein [Armatimonadota bacterium]
MELHNIPDAFHARVRIAVIASLLPGAKTFNELRDIVQATDGNLGIHLMKLEEIGFITCSKAFIGRKPQSTYAITSTGREAFIAYVKLLEEVVQGSDAGMTETE